MIIDKFDEWMAIWRSNRSVTCIEKVGPNRVDQVIIRGYDHLTDRAFALPAGELRGWCIANGIPIAEPFPNLFAGGFFFIDPQTDDQRFHVKMRWS